jgi:hypothetical protein
MTELAALMSLEVGGATPSASSSAATTPCALGTAIEA